MLALALLAGCVSHRVLRLENGLLRQQNDTLQQRVHELERRMPPPETWVRDPTPKDLHGFLDKGGYHDDWTPDATRIHLDYAGKNASFGVTMQVFASARIVLLATDDYLHLDAASNSESLVLLLVQIAALNYELLSGKLQVDPETGEVLLSVELPTADGLGMHTFLQALEQLLHTADTRYPELQQAAAGLGL